MQNDKVFFWNFSKVTFLSITGDQFNIFLYSCKLLWEFYWKLLIRSILKFYNFSVSCFLIILKLIIHLLGNVKSFFLLKYETVEVS